MSKSSIPGPENITRVELTNGIIILVYENFAAQSVVIAGSLEAGSIYEDPAKSGTASMTAAALMRGTKNRDFDAIHSSLEDIGADLDVGAGTHTTGFSGKALAEDLPVLLEILEDVLRYPAFPEQQVERLRGLGELPRRPRRVVLDAAALGRQADRRHLRSPAPARRSSAARSSS